MNDTYKIDYDFYDCCYECGAYGDDYSYDIETDSYVTVMTVHYFIIQKIPMNGDLMVSCPNCGAVMINEKGN